MAAQSTQDRLVTTIPVHFSQGPNNSLHLYQFPLQSRPLQVPPAAEIAGRRITARRKPLCSRTEIHVPLDVRPDVWNSERSLELGQARHEADSLGGTAADDAIQQHPLGEVRLRSERIPEKGVYMLGIYTDGKIHLHPFKQSLQFRPALNYLDVLSRQSSRKRSGSDSDSDDGPPPDPDDPTTPQSSRSKKPTAGKAKEVTVIAKKAPDEKGAIPFHGGLSAVRRDILSAIRKEEEEPWQEMQYCAPESIEARDTLDALLKTTDLTLIPQGYSADMLYSIMAESNRQSVTS